MENKIIFLGKSKDFELADKLCRIVEKGFDIKKKVAVSEKGFEICGDFDAVSYEYTDSINKDFDKVYTYSVGQSNADICGFNFQKREHSRSLDIFCQSYMGRVNIPISSSFTEEAVLYCVAGLIAADIPLIKALNAINAQMN